MVVWRCQCWRFYVSWLYRTAYGSSLFFSAQRVASFVKIMRREKGLVRMRTETQKKIKEYVSEMLPGQICKISSGSKPMYINCWVNKDVLACDVQDENFSIKVSFFWREKNDTLNQCSNAEKLSEKYFDSMVKVLPNGYSVCDKKGNGFRWEKKYSNGYSPKEIAKEIVCVFNLFGQLIGR